MCTNSSSTKRTSYHCLKLTYSKCHHIIVVQFALNERRRYAYDYGYEIMLWQQSSQATSNIKARAQSDVRATWNFQFKLLNDISLCPVCVSGHSIITILIIIIISVYICRQSLYTLVKLREYRRTSLY